MRKIQVLDNNTINKIAAGEVVERPSSVVKELVENSIDAGATAVTIEIKEGGISLIRITDNGNGIPKKQVKTAFVRHATNKIESVEDLESIFSLGFRGEALASIAAVSQVEMITKTHDEYMGTLIEINAGEIVTFQDAGCPEGTSLIIKNLFYNIPARRKFLKKSSTEGSYVSDVINKIALGHPEISFKYINNESVILHTSGNNDLKTAIFHVYGKDVAKKMLDLEYSHKEYKISGMIGKPELSRANRSYENLFINGRYIKNQIVASAVEEAYKTRLMIGKFPVYSLNLQVSPSLVDVNVHPTKLEVRFADDDGIYKFIYEAVLKVFKEKILIPTTDWESKPSVEVKKLIDISEQDMTSDDKISSKINSVEDNEKLIIEEKYEEEPQIENYKLKKMDLLSLSLGGKMALNEEKSSFQSKQITPPNMNIKLDNFFKEEVLVDEEKLEPFFNSYKIIGQVFNTYWIVEQGSSIFMIDQHAAHERVLFEEYTNNLKSEKIVAQRLLEPVAVNLTCKEKEVLKDNMDLFKKFGFDIDEFGEGTYVLKAVPFIFKEPTGVNYFTEIIDTLGEISIKNLYDTREHSIATIACKAAVKANDKLDIQEAKGLISQLLKLENPFSCPHGRPTIIEMTKYELEKKFKRIQ